ncbi:SET domain-containing protein [Colletotrichum tofieldiae]|nr:SET domain-containing protein [Colletotrichum tofieldiae]
MAQPKNWPAGLPYLSAPAHSRLLTPAQRQAISQKPASLPDIPAQATVLPSPLVRITPIADGTHPAKGQSGLFATRHLKPGTFVLPYLGIVHPEMPSESDYDLWLDREAEVAVDADKSGNEARFVNDYRGIADKPTRSFARFGVRDFSSGVWRFGCCLKGRMGAGRGHWEGRRDFG